MRIGVDLDNTLVCYDRVFRAIAEERHLLPTYMPPTKSNIRNHLRSVGKEEDWTRLQGIIYGSRMEDATAFEGSLEFFIKAHELDIDPVIISHRTITPYLGDGYNLHEAAQDWLIAHGFYDVARTGLGAEHVYLEITRESKLNRITSTNCAVFIDDLPEFLCEPAFPERCGRILFDPHDAHPADDRYVRVASWYEASRLIGELHDDGL